MFLFQTPTSLRAWWQRLTRVRAEAIAAQHDTEVPGERLSSPAPAHSTNPVALFLGLIALLLLSVFTGSNVLNAQERLDLKVWGIIPNVNWFSHLGTLSPEIDSKNCVITNNNGRVVRLWYNRYPGDKAGFEIPDYMGSNLIAADFTGDGKTDYFNSWLWLFDGAVEGNVLLQRPKRIAVRELSHTAYLVTDLDHDGRQDVISSGGGNLGFMLFGNHPDSSWAIQSLQAPEFANYTVHPMAYFLYDGKLRVIAIARASSEEYLCMFETDGVSKGSPTEFRTLQIINGDIETDWSVRPPRSLPFWDGARCSLYRDNETGQTFFVAGKRKNAYSDVYLITDTSFHYVMTSTTWSAMPWSELKVSVDRDTINDFMVWQAHTIEGQVRPGFAFFSKAPWYSEAKPLGWFPRIGGNQECIKPIGDVNGDGLIDIGRIGEPGLIMYLSGSGVVGTGNDSSSDISNAIEVIPSPVRRSGVLTIRSKNPLSEIRSVQILDLRGRSMGTHSNDSGLSLCSIDLSALRLGPGSYTLVVRTSAGTHVTSLAVTED